MISQLRRQFDFSLAGAITWAIVYAVFLAAVVAIVTAPAVGCAAAPTGKTHDAIVRTQGATERGAARVDSALERNLAMQRGLEELRSTPR